MNHKIFYIVTLIAQVVIAYASGISLFWMAALIIAVNIHSLALLIGKDLNVP